MLKLLIVLQPAGFYQLVIALTSEIISTFVVELSSQITNTLALANITHTLALAN
jgi:hypothetical protein